MIKIKVSINTISQEQELLKQLKDDRVAQVVDNVFRFNSLSFDDMCVLRGCSENSKTLFNRNEIGWFRLNYKLWLKIIKGTKKGSTGRKIFMKIYIYAKNIQQIARELRLHDRSNIYRWIGNLGFLVKPHIVNYYGKNTNENLVILDKQNYPFLIDLTAIYIKQQIANESLSNSE